MDAARPKLMESETRISTPTPRTEVNKFTFTSSNLVVLFVCLFVHWYVCLFVCSYVVLPRETVATTTNNFLSGSVRGNLRSVKISSFLAVEVFLW